MLVIRPHLRNLYLQTPQRESVASSDLRHTVSAAPVPPPLKSKPAQRRAEFARMTIAAPAAPKRCLQGGERQPFPLHGRIEVAQRMAGHSNAKTGSGPI